MTDKNLTEIVEGVNKSFGDLRSELEGIKESQKDVITEEKLNRITDDITTKLEEVQKENAKVQARLDRPGSETKNEEMLTEHKDAFDKFMRSKSNGEIEILAKAMSTDVNPDGGYLVRPELANFVIDRVFETSPLRQVARVETIGSKSLEVLIDDNEAAARWVGEGASDGETDTPQLGLKEIVAHKQEADPKITIEQMQDAYLDVESWLQGKVADKFARSENTSFVNGTGVNQPRGFLTYAAGDSSYTRGQIEQVNLGDASDVTADGLIELQNALKEPYQGRAVFGMERASFGNVLKLKGSDNYFFSQTLLADGQLQPRLLGKPVIFMDDMPSIGSNALALVYGDFSVGYTIVDRVGLQVLKDPYTNKGFMTYYTTKRVGGDVTNFDSLKIGKIAS
jgi:HK97 family phage major capsid protein